MSSEKVMTLWRVKGAVIREKYREEEFQAWVVSELGDEAERLAEETIRSEIKATTAYSALVVPTSHSFMSVAVTVYEPTLIGYELRVRGKSWFSDDVDPHK